MEPNLNLQLSFALFSATSPSSVMTVSNSVTLDEDAAADADCLDLIFLEGLELFMLVGEDFNFLPPRLLEIEEDGLFLVLLLIVMLLLNGVVI